MHCPLLVEISPWELQDSEECQLPLLDCEVLNPATIASFTANNKSTKQHQQELVTFLKK